MPETRRQYIRHPSGLPISYSVGTRPGQRVTELKDVSRGGLCFSTEHHLPEGAAIVVEIPVKEPPFRAEGLVAWSSARENNAYEVGIRFIHAEERHTLRMVEQICYIEHYRRQVRETEGRELTPEAAAREWIFKYAHRFPL